MEKKKLFSGKMNLELKKRIIKMEKVNRLDKVLNEEVLRRLNEKRQILSSPFSNGNIDGLKVKVI